MLPSGSHREMLSHLPGSEVSSNEQMIKMDLVHYLIKSSDVSATQTIGGRSQAQPKAPIPKETAACSDKSFS